MYLSAFNLSFPILHVPTAVAGPTIAIVNMATTCEPMSDDLFGPIIDGCRSNFDFTLLFEQTILSIPPSAILLLLAPARLAKLWRSQRKTFRTPLRTLKIVSTSMSHWNWSDIC